MPNVAKLSNELRSLQRQRSWYMKSRIMISNRLQATIAGNLCEYSSMDNEDIRQKKMGEAGKIIKNVLDKEQTTNCDTMILTVSESIKGLTVQEKHYKKEVEKVAKKLPISDWLEHDDQRGLGYLMLGTIIGETGDLANYATPGKVWRRLGCAPWTYDGNTRMGESWRKKAFNKGHTLPKAEWTEFGYSPRRRSIAYQAGEALLKQNHGPYRRRYDESKARFSTNNPEEKPIHSHKHGMLLMVKLLLKNLWIEWNPDLVRVMEY